MSKKPAKKAKAAAAARPSPARKPAPSAPSAAHKPVARPAPRVRLVEGARKPSRPGGLGRGLDALIGREATRNVAAVDAAAALSAPAEAPAPAVPVSAPPPSPAAAAPAPAAPAAEPPAPADDARRVVEVSVDLIRRSPFQPRTVFDEEALHELADSIRAHGIIQPLVCRRKGDGFLELIGGERRLRAAGLLGLKTVPVLVMEALDRDAAELALVENLQREDLNVIEEAEGYKALADEFNLTQSDIAERVGKARASVANTLRLLELPDEVKQMLGSGLLSTGHAKVLLSLPGEEERTELARRCLSEGLTVRSLERRVQDRLAGPARAPAAPRSDIPADHLRLLLDKLAARFATPARLVPSVTYANGRHGRGRIEIDFFDNDDLSRILELLGIDVNE